jgi:hypothetical protein
MNNTQLLINILFAVVMAGGSWWCKLIWNELKENKDHVQGLKLNLAENYHKKEEVAEMFKTVLERLDKLADLPLLLAQHYVTKEELKERDEKLVTTLDRIERQTRTRPAR